MAAGGLDLSRRAGPEYKSHGKSTNERESSRVLARGFDQKLQNGARGYDQKRQNRYRSVPNGPDADHGVAELPPQKKRKFSPIVWDVEVKKSTSASLTKVASSKVNGEVLDAPSDAGDKKLPCSGVEAQSLEHLPFSSVLSKGQTEGNQHEADHMVAEARSISMSRWASNEDSPRPAENVNKSFTPESGEFFRENSEEYKTSSSASDREDNSAGPSTGNESSVSGNAMEMNGRSDVDLLESDDDEETLPSRGGLNMLLGSRSVDEYEKLNKISEGTYGVVYRARDKKTGEMVALKKVKLNVGRDDEYGFPMTSLREINILLSCNHPSIVNVKEVVVGNMDSVFMVMEHVEHDLKGIMERMKQPFSTSEIKCLMLQMLTGLKYLHDNWIIHRDLKPSNLLLNNGGELKICDFGMSRLYGSPLKPYTQLVVTQWYRAPELLLGAKIYSTAIDMWSVGCMMAELLSKVPLFQGKGGSDIDQLKKIFAVLGTPSETIWPGFSTLPGAKAHFARQPYNLLRKKFPVTSFTGSAVLSDLGLDLLNKLLSYDPDKRISVNEALDHDWFREVPLAKSKEFMPTFPPRRG